MRSSKTKRVAAVTALSAALLVGGVAAAQAHDSDHPACAGKGRGEGTGAPGNDKGKGEGTGAPGKGKGKGEGTGAPSAHRRHGCKDKDHGGGGSENPGGESENPGTENPGTEHPGGEVGGSSTDTGTVSVDVDVDATVEIPDPRELAEQAVQDVVSIVKPAAVNALGQTLETAGQATDLVKNDVSALVGLLDSAMTGATNLEIGSADAAINVSQDGAVATVNVSGTTSGITGLADQLVGGAFGIATGTTSAVTNLVAGMTLPF